MSTPIAALCPFWNDISFRCVMFGNQGCILNRNEIESLNEILNMPDCVDDKFEEKSFVTPIEYINEWCKRVYNYFLKKGKWGSCYSNLVSKKYECPYFSIDHNQFLWNYQYFFYTPSINYNSPNFPLKKDLNLKWIKENIINPFLLCRRIRKLIRCWTEILPKTFILDGETSILYRENSCFLTFNLHKDKREWRFVNLCKSLGILKLKSIYYINNLEEIRADIYWNKTDICFWELFLILHYICHNEKNLFSALPLANFQNFHDFISFIIKQSKEDEIANLLFVIDIIKKTIQ